MKQRTCWHGEPPSNWQMELGLTTADSRRGRGPRPSRRANRAKWWFTRMRQTVDTADDWQPVPPRAS